MSFAVPVSIPQQILPPICTGVLLYGFLLYAYLAYMYKSPLYRSIAILSLLALSFVGNEAFLISYGAIHHMRYISVHFHRLEQLSGAFFLFALPYSLNYLLTLTPRWHRINRIIAWTGFGIAVIITTVAFIEPDLFISLTKHKATWKSVESDYGRGLEGPLYSLRDLLIGITIIYSLVCIVIDIVTHDKLKELLFPVTGLVIAIYSAVDDIQFIYTGFSIDPFGDVMFSRFSLGLTIMILFFMAEITRNFLSSTMELEQTHEKLKVSEKRYRFIIEGTSDPIFSLNENLMFADANRATLDLLPVNRNVLESTHLHDIMYTREGEQAFLHQVIDHKIAELVDEGKPVTMKLELKSRKTGEPEDYTLTLEHVTVDGRNEILVKASRESEDTLKRYVDYENGRFIINNYLMAADEISKRLTLYLPGTLPHPELTAIRLGIREMLINAIEHGNLDITFEEKTEQTMEGNYLQFLINRQKEKPYRDRKITVEFKVSRNKAAFKITDQGNGFNHQEVDSKHEDAQEQMLAHGRGIAMARNVFDEVTYNRKGNQVLLVKYFDRE